jgi:hypothetical protein
MVHPSLLTRWISESRRAPESKDTRAIDVGNRTPDGSHHGTFHHTALRRSTTDCPPQRPICYHLANHCRVPPIPFVIIIRYRAYIVDAYF